MNYVYDIVACSSNSQVHVVIKSLGDRFSIKDLGPFTFFLDVEVIQQNYVLTLTEDSFSVDMLIKLSTLDVNNVSDLLSTSDIFAWMTVLFQ